MRVNLQALALVWYCCLTYLCVNDPRPYLWVFLIYLQQSIGLSQFLVYWTKEDEEASPLRVTSVLNLNEQGNEKEKDVKNPEKPKSSIPTAPIPSTSTFYSFDKFRSQRDKDVFFGTRFVPLSSYTVSWTTYPHVVAWTCQKQRFPQSKIMLTLLPQDKAKELQLFSDHVLPYLNQGFMPMYHMDRLTKHQSYLCTPYYPMNVSTFLQTQTHFSLKEAKCLTLFILVQCLKLEQMSMAFQEKFKLDYIFLKDETKGITFDNLVMGGYHAITLLESTCSPSFIHPSYIGFLNGLLKVVGNACVRPSHYAVWSFTLNQWDHICSVNEFQQILDMLAVDVLFPTSSPSSC